MPKVKISEYSTTNADNTDIEGINIAEGCAPSGINNAIREIMVHLKEFQTGASGDGFTFAGGTLMTGTNTLSGTNVLSGSTTAAFAAGTVSAPSIAAHGDTNTGIFFPAADTIAFAEGGAEAMRIDASGRLLVGTNSSFDQNAQLQVAGTGYYVFNGFQFSNDQYATTLSLKKSRGTTVGTNTIVQNGDTIGTISFFGANGTGYNLAASINVEIDGTPGASNDMPGRLIFGTTADGSGSPTERMRIDSSGNVLFNGTSAIDSNKFQFYGQKAVSSGITQGQVNIADTNAYNATGAGGALSFSAKYNSSAAYTTMGSLEGIKENTTDGNYAGALVFRTRANGGNNDERMRIDSSGNLNIGGTLGLGKVYSQTSAAGYAYYAYGNFSNGAEGGLYTGSGYLGLNAVSAHDLRFATSNTERARITSDGYFVVGNAGSYATAITQSKSTAATTSVYNSWNSATSGTRFHLEFRDGADKISRGNITTDGANTTYATSSDYRLKENVVPLVGALEKVAQLKPSTWTWKDNKKDGQGFIAHELAEVVPQAVTGEKDATRLEQYEVTPAVYEDVVVPAILDEEGNQVEPERTEKRLVSEAVMGEREVPVYQGVDTSFLVATLTAAIQELKAELDAAKDRIAALEAK